MKIPDIDFKDLEFLYLEPGIYQPNIDIYKPHNQAMATEDDKLKKSEYFIVNRHDVQIGKTPYKYYSVKRLGPTKHHLIRSYEVERWNIAAQILKKVV